MLSLRFFKHHFSANLCRSCGSILFGTLLLFIPYPLAADQTKSACVDQEQIVLGQCRFRFNKICPTEVIPSVASVEILDGNSQKIYQSNHLMPLAVFYQLKSGLHQFKTGEQIGIYSEESLLAWVVMVKPDCQLEFKSLESEAMYYCDQCQTEYYDDRILLRGVQSKTPSNANKLFTLTIYRDLRFAFGAM